MEFGPKRGHWLFIFENFFKDFSLLIIALIVGLIQGDMDIFLENIGVLVVVLLGPVGRVIRYLTTVYRVDSERLTVKSGLFMKNQLEVPLSTITTVDFSQNILHQFFGVYRLNVDNASNVSETRTKINMTFAKEDALAVRNLLIQGRDGLDGFNLAGEKGLDKADDTTACRRIRVKSSDLVLMGLLKSKGVFFAQLIALLTTAMALLNVSTRDLSGAAVDFVLDLGIGLSVLAAVFCVFLLSLLCGMAGSLIRYYGFTVADNGEAVKIEYGLLTKKRYTIQKKRISGFSYQQSMLMRLFHTGTLQLFAIGYGHGGEEESSEEPVLFPLVREERVRRVIGEILPQMKETAPYTKAKKGSLHYFFYGFGFVLALGLFGASVYCSVNIPYCGYLWLCGSLILIYSVAGRVQEYRNTGIYGTDENFSLVYGGFLKTTIFVKTGHIESISQKGSIWKQRKGIASITVSYIAPLTSANQTVNNVPVECLEKVKNLLIY